MELDEVITENELKIYPNPASSILTINVGKESTQINASLSNISGQIMKTKSGSGSLQFDLSDLNKGIFIVNIQYDNEHIKRKIIVQ